MFRQFLFHIGITFLPKPLLLNITLYRYYTPLEIKEWVVNSKPHISCTVYIKIILEIPSKCSIV